MIALRCGLLILGILATGFATLRILRCKSPNGLIDVGLAVAAGMTATMLVGYVFLFAFGTVSFFPTLALHLASTAWLMRRRLPLLRWTRPPVFLAAIVFAFGVFAIGSNSVPFRGYDEKATFGLKGKALLYERDIDGQVFQDVDVVHYHPDYPLGVPLLMALSGWVAEGNPTDPEGTVPAATAAEWIERHDAIDAYFPVAQLWTLAISCLLLGWAWHRTGNAWASVLLLGVALPAVILVPAIAHNAVIADWRSFGDADRPLTLLLGATGFAYAAWVSRGDRSWLWLAALMAAGTVMLKNEALITLPALLAATFFVRRPLFKSSVLRLGVPLALTAGMVAIIKGRTAGAPYDEHFLGALLATSPTVWLERIPEMLRTTYGVLLWSGTWYFWLLFFLLAVPIAWRGSASSRILSLWVLFALTLLMGAVLVTPNHLQWQVQTAVNRLWFHISLPAGLLVVDAYVTLWSRANRASFLNPDTVSPFTAED